MPGLQPKSRVDPISVIHKITDDVPINFKTQGVGVYLQPEWAAKLGDNKHLFASADDQSPSAYAAVIYTVPAGKTLYIGAFSGGCCAWDLVTDGDKNQICSGVLLTVTLGIQASIGGNGGFCVSFPTPIAVAEGDQVWAYCYNYTGHKCGLRVSIAAYEV